MRVRLFAVFYAFFGAITYGFILASEFYADLEIVLLNAASSISVIVLLLFGLKIYGAFDIRTLFNSTYIFFIFGSVVLSLFFSVELRYVESITNIAFNSINFAEAVALSAFPIFVINLGFLFFPAQKKDIECKHDLRVDEGLLKVGETFYWGGLPVFVWKGIAVARFALVNGYEAFYNTSLSDVVDFPILIQIGTNFFYLGFFLIISSIPTRERALKYFIIFFLVSVIDSLKGNRGLMFIIPLFSFWYFGHFYGMVLGFRQAIKGVLFFALLVSGANSLLVHRSGEDESRIALVAFVLSASTTNRVINYYLDNRHDLPDPEIGYIFEPFIFPINYIMNWTALAQGQSEEVVRIRENLNHRLTFHVSREYYLKGGGLGSSFVLEMYEFGVLGVILFSLLFAALLEMYIASMRRSRLAVFLSFLIITHILMMPRAEYFPGVWSIAKYTILYYAALTLARGIRFRIQITKQAAHA